MDSLLLVQAGLSPVPKLQLFQVLAEKALFPVHSLIQVLFLQDRLYPLPLLFLQKLPAPFGVQALRFFQALVEMALILQVLYQVSVPAEHREALLSAPLGV